MMLPKPASVIILGGGIGEAVADVTHDGRAFLNVELGVIENSGVPVITGDMEDPRLFGRILRGAMPLAVLTPFSAEYTDVGVTSANIAEALVRGERWLWVCHHTESGIMKELRDARVLMEIVTTLQDEVTVDRSRETGLLIARWIETRLARIDAEIVSRLAVLDTDPEMFVIMIKRMEEHIHIRIVAACLALAIFRFANDNPASRWRAAKKIGLIKDNMEEIVEMTRLGVDRRYCRPSSLQMEADPRLNLIDGSTYEKDGIGVIFGLFERI
jgi:hypothetical protein